MPVIVDSSNVVNDPETAPDKLRAEIGRYYSTNTSPSQQSANPFRDGIKTDLIVDNLEPSEQLIPTSRARIYISGQENKFRDQIQWNEFVKETIKTDVSYLDHQFAFSGVEIENNFVKNFHHPTYEDETKGFNSNQLLNYNLISYPHKDLNEEVRRVGDLVTNFDPEDYLVFGRNEFKTLMSQFSNRIANYIGDSREIELKQRNIFDLSTPTFTAVPTGSFPFYYSKILPFRNLNDPFNNAMKQYGKTKNILQSIKKDLSFSNRSFNMGENVINGKIYNLINLMTSTRIVNLQVETDELFLLPRDEVEHDNPARRFVEQVNTVRFLSEMRGLMDSNLRGGRSRPIKDILNGISCSSFFLSYKIEKYLDNDLGQPIQTYYTNDRTFYDTQLKYGRKYIYKTKVLICVLGSSYSYSNLFISQNETNMATPNGSVATSNPADFSFIANEKFRAYVDVVVTPSFQILEYEVNVDTVAFMDTPVSPPQVSFHNNSKKANIELFFSPLFAKIPTSQPNVEISEQHYEDILVRPLKALTKEDERVLELVALSKTDEIRSDYFTGIYEVYRTTTPPQSESDFADKFLALVDDKSTLAYPAEMQLPDFSLDNMDGYFEDFVTPNKKYYYAFRALTYHGTPSNLTVPYEIELVKDSDEYKIFVSQYQYPDSIDYTYNKNAKRILRINPNIERLIFTEEDSMTGFRLDDGNLVPKNGSKTFKIRVTSKHTGKKIDLNLNFLLDDRTNNQQN